MQVLGYSLQVVQTKALNSESKYSHAQSDIHVPELQKLFLQSVPEESVEGTVITFDNANKTVVLDLSSI